MPQMKPQMLMTRMSVIECFLVRSMRGSFRPANFSTSDAVTRAGFFIPPVDHTTGPAAIQPVFVAAK